MLQTLTALLLAAALAPCLAQEAGGAVSGPIPDPPAQRALSNDAIIRMSKAGLDEALLLQTIRSQPGAYATSPDDMIALKNAGVSQAVISAMLARNSGLSEHTAPPAVDPTPISPAVDDIGIYYKLRESNDWQPMPLELVNYRQGGALKSLATNGIIKKDMNGHVAGSAAKLNLRAGDQVLIYAPSGTAAEEYLLLHFRQHADNREFRTETGNVFHSKTGADRDAVRFNAHKIAAHMYTFEIAEDIGPGEYGVLPPGNANQRGMANAGKIYTFAISK